MKCQRPDCECEATHEVIWQTHYMIAPAFSYDCDDHAQEWNRTDPRYARCSVTRIQTEKRAGKMDREQILDVIQDIMITDGPDGHWDGGDVITDFIMALLDGQEKEWIERYSRRIERRRLGHYDLYEEYEKGAG